MSNIYNLDDYRNRKAKTVYTPYEPFDFNKIWEAMFDDEPSDPEGLKDAIKRHPSNYGKGL